MGRREEILDALIKKLREEGLQTNFTISEVAKSVDIGKSTIYEYFSTKDELLSEALVRLFDDGMKQIQNRTMDPTLSFEESLKEELRFSMSLAADSAPIVRLITPEFRDTIPDELKGQFRDEMLKTLAVYRNIFQRIINKGLEEGVLQEDNLMMNSVLFGSLIGGSINHVSRAKNGFDVDVDMNEHIDAIYHAVIKIFN